MDTGNEQTCGEMKDTEQGERESTVDDHEPNPSIYEDDRREAV